MNRDEKPIFRGSELPKMLILAGLLLLGWPLVIYYGFFNKPQAKPVAPPIATLPPLPPPDPSPEFKAVIDKTERGIRDEPAIALLFKRVQDNPDTLGKDARREVLPIDLLMTPWKYRGLPIRLEGFAQQVYAHDGEAPELTKKGRFYEVWFRSDQPRQGTYPCCVFVEDVPGTLPGGRNLEERVSLEGYFLKLYKYRAADNWRFAPLLVGRITHVPNAMRPAPETSTSVYVAWLLVLLFVYISFRVFFAIRKTWVKRPANSWSTATESIEPETLKRWLAEPSPEQDVEN